MGRITIVIGGLLIILGLLAYFVFAEPDDAGHVSVTALIPAFFGLPIAILGAVALKESARKHAMHAAVLLGVLGLVGALMRPVPKMFRGEFTLSTASSVQLIMAAICLVFVILCVRSFINARRKAA